MEAATVMRRGSEVVLVNETTKTAIGLSWEKADGLSRLLRMKARGLLRPERDALDENVAVSRQDASLLVEWHAAVFLTVPLKAGIAIANALTVKAREIEEALVAEQIIDDGALLVRAGVPFGLTDRPDIQREIRKEAAWSPFLRKFMPMRGIRSGEVFGVPRLRQTPPKENDRA